MCGRYSVASDKENEEIRKILDEISNDKSQSDRLAKLKPAEIARTDTAPVLITEHGETRAVLMQFGIPLQYGTGVEPNARRETIFQKPSWRDIIKTNRCVVPATGFFEWSHDEAGNAKDKHMITHADQSLLYMAGIYGNYKDASGREYMAFAVVTAAANDTMLGLHDRMPVILKTPEDRAAWMSDLEAAKIILSLNDEEQYLLRKIENLKKSKKQEKVQQISMF